MWYFVAGAVLIAIAVAVTLVRAKGLLGGGELAARADVDAVLAVHGPERCRRAADLLASCARRGRAERLHRIWDRLEGPLLQALPDAAPADKDALIAALTACHGITRHRDYQRRIMDLRRSLV